MTLLFMEGFEIDGGNSTALDRKYATATSASGSTTGRLHGSAASIANNFELRTRTLASPTSTVVLGFGWKDTNSGTTAEDFQFNIMSDTDVQLTLVNVTVSSTTYRWDLYRGATLLGSSAAYSTLNWHYFELTATIHQTTGSYEFRANETLDFQDVGPVNTADSGAANWDTLEMVNTTADGNMAIDDIYVLDNSGSVNNSFLGDSVIEGRLPTSDSTPLDWTPSSGANHWELVDDTSDSTYVSSGTATDKEMFGFDALSFITGTIHGVLQMATVGLDALGTRTVRHLSTSGATTTNGVSQVIETTGFITVYDIIELDPNTAAGWTLSGLNSATFGLELVS